MVQHLITDGIGALYSVTLCC